jgi:GntR family transcriptional repressor for pyruvate dehydrogenase complex
MKRLSRKRLPDLVCKTILDYIKDQGLKPGDKLPGEHVLMKELGIGRTSIREGVKKLESVGLVKSRQGLGILLNEVTLDTILSPGEFNLGEFLKLSSKDLADVLDFRSLIEVEACSQAAACAKASDFEIMNSALENMKANLGNIEVFNKNDIIFHRQIVVSTGNKVFLKVFDLLMDVFWRQYEISGNIPGSMEKAYNFHCEIYTLLKGNKRAKAMTTMANHIANTKTVIVGWHEQNKH